MVRLDKTILKGLRKTTRDNAVDLARLIPWIDAAERLIPAYDELEGALRRLILAGEIQEAGPTQNYAAHNSVSFAIFGISKRPREDHQPADQSRGSSALARAR